MTQQYQLSSVSVVISLNNEEYNITSLYSLLKKTLENTSRPYEIIFVDDGSEDNTYVRLCELFIRDRSVNIIKLSRRFGQCIGLFTGINASRGEIVVTLDGDLQHDPVAIPQFLDGIESGYDIVNGRKTKRRDNFFLRTMPAFIAKRIVTWIFGVDLLDINSSYRAYRKKIILDIGQYGEYLRFIPLLAKEKNLQIKEIEIRCERRRFGRTHYNFMSRIKKIRSDVTILFRLKKSSCIKKQTTQIEYTIVEKKFHEAFVSR